MSKLDFTTYQRERRQERRAYLISLLGGKCSNCGSVSTLQFDHIDRSKKSFNISEMLTSSREVLAEELSKCQLLCEACHYRKTTLERGLKPMGHGTLNSYSHGKCRCPDCRSAWNTHSRLYKQRRRAALTQR